MSQQSLIRKESTMGKIFAKMRFTDDFRHAHNKNSVIARMSIASILIIRDET